MVEVALGVHALALAATLIAAGEPRRAGSEARRTTLVVGVADAQTGAAIEGAEVSIPELTMAARSNALGEARIQDIPQGKYIVRVRFLGYAMSEVALRMLRDTVGAVFRLERAPTTISTVTIKGRAVPIRLKDFEIRRHQAVGRFLLNEELEKVGLQEFPLVVSTKIPGLRAYTDLVGHWHIASTRDYINLTGSVSPCDIQVYLDDLPLGVDELDDLRTRDLEGVEWYTAAEVPVRYRTKRYGCGVMLLWSKWR